MAVINFARREIITKVVYYGARGAGTTATLRRLYLEADGEPVGGMIPFGPSDSGEMTLVFELIPKRITIPGFSVKLRLYSLPGGLSDPEHRAEILRDLDGVIFVADARPKNAENNLEALLDLDRWLKGSGLDLADLPVVFQVNHRDDPSALPIDEVVYDLNPYDHPVFGSSVPAGTGLREPLAALADQLAVRLRANLAGEPTSLHVHAIHRRKAATIEQVVDAHKRAIMIAKERPATGADEDTAPPWSRTHYDVLPISHVIDLAYQPPRLVGMRPVHVLATRIEHDQVMLDLVLDDAEGASPSRLRVNLRPPADETTPTLQHHSSPNPPSLPTDLTTGSTTNPTVPIARDDTSQALGYALLGAGAGLVAGLLAGFLLWA